MSHASPATAFDSVLISGFGGPESPDEIRPFLRNVLRGRPVPPERIEEVAHHYEAVGGRSPYNDLTCQQARAIESELARAGTALPVHVGMVHWRPFLADTLREMTGRGLRRAVLVVPAPHRCEASWDKYLNAVESARVEIGGPPFSVATLDPWHLDDGFLEAQAAPLASALQEIPAADRTATEVVFTAHSVPQPMSDRANYAGQLSESARAVAGRVNHARWSIAFQSRSGRPEDPWAGPDIVDHLGDLAKRDVRHALIVPVGFVCDHVEVLFDLDIEAAAAAGELGIGFRRIPTVGCHPAFIRMLADRVRALAAPPGNA